jgi:alkylhydroperoxidase family enzyme
MTPPRIAPVATLTPDQQEMIGQGLFAGDRPLNIFTSLAHHPRLLRRFALLGGAFLTDGLLPPREREVVILRVGWRCQSVYEFGQHTLLGRRAGLTDAEIAALAEARDHEWSDGDQALIALADELCATNNVSDATWARLAGRFSEPELLELVLLAGYYRMVSGFLNTIGIELDPGVPGWPARAPTAG